MNQTTLRHPLTNARTIGSARHGAMHWWAQRLTALLLIPMVLWFISGLIETQGDYNSLIQWFQQPLSFGAAILLFLMLVYHTQLGLQVIIEDYISDSLLRTVLLWINKGVAVVSSVVTTIALFEIRFMPF